MKIVQIIPCTVDLWVEYKFDEGNYTTKVVCFALVEDDDGDRSISGVDCDHLFEIAETSSNFVCYRNKPIPE